MPTTTNFGWTTPADTDLVKDGAAAIRTLAGNIDTSLVDLKGGTTGQVLAKNSNTDLDYIWVAQDDSNAIQNAIIDAKGDLIVGTAADTPARLAVGITNGQVLTVDNVEASGLKWALPASGGMTSLATGSLTGSSLDLQTISGSYQDLRLVLRNCQTVSDTEVRIRLNNLSTGIYNSLNNYNDNGAPGAVSNVTATSFYATYFDTDGSTMGAMIIDIFDYINTSADKQVRIQYNYTKFNGNINNTRVVGACRTTNAIDRIQVFPDAGNWNAGTYELFGVK